MLNESNRIINYWVSHWQRIEGYDVVAIVERPGGCLHYYLVSPKDGLKVHRRNCVSYDVTLKGPCIEFTIYRKDNKHTKKSPPSIRQTSPLYLIDGIELLGKDQICKHLKDKAEKDEFNVNSKAALTEMEKALKKLAELRQQL